MSKQAEREFALKADQRGLYRRPFNCPRVLREFGIAMEILREHHPGGAILDLGCGPGWTTLFLAKAGYTAVGVDISERMIEIANDRAQQEGSEATFIVADIEALDLPQRDFDAVLLFDALHHCPGYAEVLRRAQDHLRPKGHLLLFEPSWLHRYSPHARSFSATYGVTELGFSRTNLRRALRAAGFSKYTFLHDPGPGFRGLWGFVMANLRLWCNYWWCFPRLKQIVLAQK